MPLKKFAGAFALALIAAACTSEGVPPPPDYAALVAEPGRPAEDVARDASRQPAAVLALAGVDPGDTVLEIEAGNGYFTELFSRAVGAEGKVYMQNPAAFDPFLSDTVAQRLEDRLINVSYLKSDFDAFGLPDASVDIATWFQGPHELWYMPEGATEKLGDPEKSFSEIARVLKPGGIFIVVDHVAPAGSPPTTGGDTHRIDPAILHDMAEAAGFTLTEESDIFRNPKDDGLTNVFDPAIRGKTDQVVLIFTRP